jgi:hypothetical protein
LVTDAPIRDRQESMMDMSALFAGISGLLGAAIGGFATYKIQSRQLKHQEELLLYQRGVNALSKAGGLSAEIGAALQGCIGGIGSEEDRARFESHVRSFRAFYITEGYFLPREVRQKLGENISGAETLATDLRDPKFKSEMAMKWHDSLTDIQNLIDKYLKPLHDVYDRIASE